MADNQANSTMDCEPSKNNREKLSLKQKALIALVLAVVYAPGILLGTIGTGPANNLYNPIEIIFLVLTAGTVFAIGGFIIGFVIGAAISIGFAILTGRIKIENNRLPVKTMAIGGIPLGSIAASVAVMFVVIVYGFVYQ